MVPGKAVGLREYVSDALVDVQKPRVRCPNPQTAVAVTKQFVRLRGLYRRWERIRHLRPAVSKSSDTTDHRDQRRTIIGLSKPLDSVRLRRQSVELSRA